MMAQSRRRRIASAALLANLLGYSAVATAADQPAAAGAAPAEVAPARPPMVVSKSARRLPRNYGKVNLSDAQRFKIYDIQAVFNSQIDVLEQQITQLKAARDAQVRGVLTLQQQRRLADLAGGAQTPQAKAMDVPAQGPQPQVAPRQDDVVNNANAGGAFAGGAVAGETGVPDAEAK